MKPHRACQAIFTATLSLLLAGCVPRLSLPSAQGEGADEQAATPTPVVIVVTATPAPTYTPEPTPAVVKIALHSVSGPLLLQTAKTVITATLDGRDQAGEALAGDLIIERLTTDSLKQSSTTITGSLTTRTMAVLTRDDDTGDLLQSAVYRKVGGAYWMEQFAPAGEYSCIKIEFPSEQDPFYRGQTAFEELLQRRQTFMVGARVGEAVVNGIQVNHYRLDADRSNQEARSSEDVGVREYADRLNLLAGDMYLAVEGDYLVRYRAEYEGELKDYGFTGRLRLDVDLTRPGGVSGVTLPDSCNAAEARANLPSTVGKAELLHFYPFYDTGVVGATKSSLTLSLRGRGTNGRSVAGGITIQYTEDMEHDRQLLAIEGLGAPSISSAPELENLSVRRVSLYVLDGSAYLYTEGKNARDTRCTTINTSDRDEVMRWMSPEGMTNVFVDTGILYGILVKDEKINGVTARHYRLDVVATNAAAEKGKNMDHILPKLTRGDVYISRDGEHVVRMTAEATGPVEAMHFTGRVTLRYDFTTSSRAVTIQLPKTCSNAKPS